MSNYGLDNVAAPIDFVDVALFQALPPLPGVNVDYKGYNEFVLYGIDYNSDIL